MELSIHACFKMPSSYHFYKFELRLCIVRTMASICNDCKGRKVTPSDAIDISSDFFFVSLWNHKQGVNCL